jgi:hypothetical protein
VADPRHRADFHQLSAGVRPARRHPAHSADSDAGRGRAPGIGVHLSILRLAARCRAAPLGPDLRQRERGHTRAPRDLHRRGGFGSPGRYRSGGVRRPLRRPVAHPVCPRGRGSHSDAVRLSGRGVPDDGDPGSRSGRGFPPPRARRGRGGVHHRIRRSPALSTPGAAGGAGPDRVALGAAASPGHRGCGRRRPGRALVPALSPGPRRRRPAGFTDRMGLGGRAVSVSGAAGPHRRGRGRSGGDAPPGPAGGGSGSRGAVAVVDVSLSDLQDRSGGSLRAVAEGRMG